MIKLCNNNLSILLASLQTQRKHFQLWFTKTINNNMISHVHCSLLTSACLTKITQTQNNLQYVITSVIYICNIRKTYINFTKLQVKNTSEYSQQYHIMQRKLILKTKPSVCLSVCHNSLSLVSNTDRFLSRKFCLWDLMTLIWTKTFWTYK